MRVWFFSQCMLDVIIMYIYIMGKIAEFGF